RLNNAGLFGQQLGANTVSNIGGGGNPNLPVGGSYFGGPGSLAFLPYNARGGGPVDLSRYQKGTPGYVSTPGHPIKSGGPATDAGSAALTPGEVVLNKDQQAAVMPVPGLEHRLLPEQIAALARMRNAPFPRRR